MSTVDLSLRLARPLAGMCHHGDVVGLTIDATPEHLTDFVRSYASVQTVEAGPVPFDWCDACLGGGL